MPNNDKVEVEVSDNNPDKPVTSGVLRKRPRFSAKVDQDIMEFIKNGDHFQELKDKLNELEAEIEWIDGHNTATIWKKMNSRFVKNWVPKCKAVWADFLDRFEKISIPLDESLKAAVIDALPRLVDVVPDDKALGKLVEGEQKFEMIWLKEDRENLSQSVKGFLEIMKKEEIRKMYMKETRRNVNHNHLLLLQQIGFVEQMKSKHSELEVTLDLQKDEIYFEGPLEQLTDAKVNYFLIMEEIDEDVLILPSNVVSHIIASKTGKKYIRGRLLCEAISAIILPEEDNTVRIVAKNLKEFKKAKDLLCNSMREARIDFPEGNNIFFMNTKWKELSARLRRQQLINVRIDLELRSIVLRGATYVVDKAEKEIATYIKSQIIRIREQLVSHGVARFLSKNLTDEINSIKAKLKDDLLEIKISIEVAKAFSVIMSKGTEVGLRECEKCITELCQLVTDGKREFRSAGLHQLLYGVTGQRHMKVIEIERNVIIEISSERKKKVKETSRIEIEVLRKELEKEQDTKFSSEESHRTSVTDCKTVGCTYDLCNFTTKEGLRVSWKYGNIAHESVSVQFADTTATLTRSNHYSNRGCEALVYM